METSIFICVVLVRPPGRERHFRGPREDHLKVAKRWPGSPRECQSESELSQEPELCILTLVVCLINSVNVHESLVLSFFTRKWRGWDQVVFEVLSGSLRVQRFKAKPTIGRGGLLKIISSLGRLTRSRHARTALRKESSLSSSCFRI